MACACHQLSSALTLRALLLELLHEAGCKLLLGQDLALALALGALLDVVRVICAASSAVRTDDSPVIGDLKLLAEVQLFQCYFNFQLDVWPSLLSHPSNSTCQSKLKNPLTYLPPKRPPNKSKGLPDDSGLLTHSSPQRSYLRRSSGSERASYAAAMSWNFYRASGSSGFLSGWY